MITLDTEISKLSRVGTATAKKLAAIDIRTVRDLLFYFPYRYDDFSQVTPIDKLQAGERANIVGKIELIQNKRSFRKRMYVTEALVSDDSGEIKVIWFNQPFIGRNLKNGDRVSLAGKVDSDFTGLLLSSPLYEKISTGGAIHTQGLVPNYHLTANLTQKQIRFLIKQVVAAADAIPDWLPAEIISGQKLLSLSAAVKKIHFPKNKLETEKARERLAFNELFLIQLGAQLVKKSLAASRAPAIKFYEAETKNFVNSLPFKLTDAQRKAAWEILRDLEKTKPMSRLLEGDVGSGKTLVALIAMLNVALNKKQAVIMAPTEILARQHFETIKKFIGGYSSVALLTRSQFSIFNFQFSNNEQISNDKISKKFILENTSNGKINIIIGTHALIQEKIEFKNLALAVIDEQHRFGVEQRKMLTEKSSGALMPHFLSMTATPIPRSLALSLYGDLDLSVINQMPANRKKIITKIVAENQRAQAYEFIRGQIKLGRQAFVICPLIDLSDKLGVKSVEEEYKKLDKIIFPDLAMGKLHGRMKSAEKEKIMQEFLDNKIKILVATSVVEVGVDVPNASLMMIEGADRFGLAQLHQFRGRVGRSAEQSYCFLFTESDATKTLNRLAALVKYNNGFELAKIDLKFRGPGEVYGLEQKGFLDLKIASLFDYNLMKQAREQAAKLLETDSTLVKWPVLKEKLGDWEKGAHLE